MRIISPFVVTCLTTALLACSQSKPGAGPPSGNGGQVSVGGTSATPTGGSAGAATGGATTQASGGVTGSGGKIGSGGAAGLGGRSATGGATGGTTGAAGGATADAAAPVGSSGCGTTTLPTACNNTTTGPCTIDVAGLSRQYFVVLPSNYDPTAPTAVVFAWHYRGGTAAGLLPSSSTFGGFGVSGFYGVQKGYPNAIYVAPQGLDSGSDAGNDYGWPNTGGEDIAFAKAMVAWVEAHFCVDTSRIFSTGMSYGGVMSETIACQMPDVFRAIGSIAGSLFGSRGCVSHPIAAWITHGDADTTVPIAGDQTARDLILKDNGCDTSSTKEVDLVDSNTKATAPCVVYDQCTAGSYPVVWCVVPGEGHAIPSFAATEIASFFTKF